MLGSRRRVRPPFSLPGRAVRAEGWRRTLCIRLLADHGQRGRLLELLRRLPPGPLNESDGRKRGTDWNDKRINYGAGDF